MTDVEKLRNDLSACGARLGVVDPCFHRVMGAYPAIADVYEALRAEKRFDLSDKLRAALAEMRDGASYAFPSRYVDLK